ncbi:MAG TPA: Ig-like domain-containing protein [Saprospiraceae bacterium]|nr:Ig-like domain-containing protein [Saprospiraceae bacterium]
MNNISLVSLLKGNSFFIILPFIFLSGNISAQRMWINEVAITPNPADDFIEIVVEQGTDLTKVEMVFYSDGELIGSILVNGASGFTMGDRQSGFILYTTSSVPIDFTDEIALLYDGVVVEYLSFNKGASIVAMDGPAAGYPSQDITVDESVGIIYRQGISGVIAADFSFSGTSTSTEGAINDGQSFGAPTMGASLNDTPVPPASEPVPSGSNIEYTLEIENSGAGSADSVIINRTTPVDPNTTLIPGSFRSTPVAYDFYVLNAQEDNSKTLGLKGIDLDGNQGLDLTFSITQGPANGSLGAIVPVGTDSATVDYSPNADYFGSDRIEYKVVDADNNESPGFVEIQVQPVNDPLQATCGGNQIVTNDGTMQSVSAWATGITPGPANEAYQTVTFFTEPGDISNPAAFTVPPAVDAGTGNLTFTPDATASGVVNVTFNITDNAGDTQTCNFTITLNRVPEPEDDMLMVASDENLSEDLFVDNGNGIDYLGFPTGAISSFGGGDLGGSVTSNTAGSSVSLANGTLTVESTGAISLTGPNLTVGTYTFSYRLQNAVGNDEGAVTIEVIPPDDPPMVNSVSPADNATNVPVDADIIVTFSEQVTPAAGAFTVQDEANNFITFNGISSMDGITWTIDIQGDLPPDETITLTVVAANVTDDDTNDPPDNMVTDFVSSFTTIGVPPMAMLDGPAASSSVGDDFHTDINTPFSTSGVSDNLLNNDNLGVPDAEVVTYGPPNNPAATTVGNNGATKEGGTITVNATGVFTYTPPSNFTGLDSFSYVIQNPYGMSTGRVGIAVGDRPTCGPTDSYTATGNIQIDINAANGVLANDTGDGLSAAVNVNPTNGTLNLSADGSFTYESNAGYTGTDVFTYDITNGFGSQTCNTQIVVSNTIWFVDVNGTGTNQGTYSNPFRTIAAFNGSALPGNGDVIALMSGTYSEADGFNLQDNQKLIGKGVILDSYFTADDNSVASYQTYAASAGSGSAIPIINSTGTGNAGVDLALNNTVAGLNISNTGGYGIDGGAVGSPTIAQVSINGNGGAIRVSTSGAFGSNVNFVNLNSNASFDDAIHLVNVTGTLGISGGLISNPTNQIFDISGGSVNIVYPGGVTKEAGLAQSGIRISNHSGAISVSGTTRLGLGGSALTNTAMILTNNTGTYTFNGFQATCINAGAILADDGGTLNILPSGTFNIISCTSSGTPPAFKGISLVNGTQIGSSGITFNLTTVLGATVGIELNGTGTNPFVITGDGTMTRNGSGGVLSLCGTGLSLVNAFNVTLNAVDFGNNTGDAINSTGGGGFTFSSIDVNNPTGNGWYARNLTGTNRINKGSLFQRINTNTSSAIDLRNSTEDLTLLEINDTDFTNGTSGRSVVLIEQEGAANMEVHINNGCVFSDLFGQALTSQSGQAPGSTGTLTTLVDNVFFQNAKGTNGENNLALIANNGATQAATVRNSSFTQVGKGGGVANTSILRTQNDGGTWTGVVGETNTLNDFTFNIGGRHGIGHVASGQNTTVEATTILKIDNNSVQALGDREGVYTSTREYINAADIVVEDNTIGTVTTTRGVAVDQEIMEFQVRADNLNAYTLNLLVRNNTLQSSHPGNTFEVGHIGIPVFDNAGINATISNNSVIGSTNISHIGIELEDGDGCFNISGNSLSPATPTILFGAYGAGVFNVTQASQAMLSSSNSSATITLDSSPTVNYNSPTCTLPSNN